MQEIEALKMKLSYKQTAIVLLNKKLSQLENKNQELEIKLAYN